MKSNSGVRERILSCANMSISKVTSRHRCFMGVCLKPSKAKGQRLGASLRNNAETRSIIKSVLLSLRRCFNGRNPGLTRWIPCGLWPSRKVVYFGAGGARTNRAQLCPILYLSLNETAEKPRSASLGASSSAWGKYPSQSLCLREVLILMNF